MKKYYIIYLRGKDVRGEYAMEKVITGVNNIDDIISEIAEKYKLEFILEKEDAMYTTYKNIKEDFDVKLIVEWHDLE